METLWIIYFNVILLVIASSPDSSEDETVTAAYSNSTVTATPSGILCSHCGDMHQILKSVLVFGVQQRKSSRHPNKQLISMYDFQITIRNDGQA